MKTYVLTIASAVAVALAFRVPATLDLAWGQEALLLFAGISLLNILYIPRYPRSYALRLVLRLKPGQKVEAEGK